MSLTNDQFEDLIHIGDGRIENLVVCRESGLYSNDLLEGMVNQTLGYCSTIRGVDAVREEGLQPLVGRSCFTCSRLRTRKTRAVLFEHEGTLYLYSAGSAAAVNDDTGDNDFVALLCDVIEQFRPKNLHIATLSRIIRCVDFIGRLHGLALRHIDTVYVGGMPINLRTQQGLVMWQTLSMVATIERELIVQRLTAGRINKFTRGEWLLGTSGVPNGYRLVDRKLVVDDGQVDQVRKMLIVLADASLSNWRVMRHLGTLGLQGPGKPGAAEKSKNFGEYRCPSTKVARLLAWSDLYETGRYDIQLPNPFPGLSKVAGLEVKPDPTGKLRDGVLVFRYVPGVPDGGWADEEVFELLRRRREKLDTRRWQMNGGAGAHRRRRPLINLGRWSDDQYQYVLAAHAGRYEVRRWPLEFGEPA